MLYTRRVIVIEFKRILCPIDLSEMSRRALAHAAALARWYGARLTVLHVVPTFDAVQVRSPALIGAVRIEYPARREDVLAEVRRVAIDQAGAAPDATFAAESGDPVTTIVDQALAMSADLVVMGTHGHRGFKRAVLGSVAEHLLREAPCPVLTIPPHARADTAGAVTFKTIVCPIDFSQASLQALGFALDLARQANGAVTLLHVVEWLADHEPQGQAHLNVEDAWRLMIEGARQRLRSLITGESADWCDIAPQVVAGRPYRKILEAAESKPADLIVMGAQGVGGVRLALFGSTTQQVVRGANCPVLTVRSAE
jgi:nucleotide-binding universal stress UspA family protein